MALQDLYRRIRRLISRAFTDQDKQLLFDQVERLENQLQIALEHIVSQNRNAAEISKKLQSEVKENKTLWDQVEYLTTELNKERVLREKHVCHRPKADCQKDQNVGHNLNKQLEELQKKLVEQERQQQELEQQQRMKTYVKLGTRLAEQSELRQMSKNANQIHEEAEQRRNTQIAEEIHRNTLLQQKLQEAECIISEQNVILDRIKQEIKLLRQKHHKETTKVSLPAKSLEAREELKQYQVLSLKQTVKDLPEESTSLWHCNAPRTC